MKIDGEIIEVLFDVGWVKIVFLLDDYNYVGNFDCVFFVFVECGNSSYVCLDVFILVVLGKYKVEGFIFCGFFEILEVVVVS